MDISMMAENKRTDTAFSLPALYSPRYGTVPRRYEETRPVKIQGFAHSKILGIGHDLERRAVERFEAEKLQAIRQSEQAVWAEAEQLKKIALSKARDEAAIDQEKAIKKLQKAHEKALKEEALKVEMAMQKLAVEQVKQERIEGDQRLRAAVKLTEDKCYREKLEAVAAARAEEQKAAAEQLAKTLMEQAVKLENAMAKAREEKEQALKNLKEIMTKQQENAVAEARKQEQKIADDKIKDLTATFTRKIDSLKEDISQREAAISSHLKTIYQLEKAKASCEVCLQDTRTEFQDFIDTLKPLFQQQQAEFLISPVYIDELEKKGYFRKKIA